MATSPLVDTVRPVPRLVRAHDQVAEHYRQKIRDGDLEPGQPFPSVREVISAWAVSTNTVQRALRLLRDEGWIDFRQGRHPSVIGIPKQSP